jgi:uncharacterized protein (UPF0332 family)
MPDYDKSPFFPCNFQKVQQICFDFSWKHLLIRHNQKLGIIAATDLHDGTQDKVRSMYYFRKNGAWYQKKNLLKRVEVAREDGRGEAANKILAIIKREQERSFWRRINYTCGKVKGKSPISIHVPRNGRDDHINEYSTQATVHEAIWANIYYKQLYLTEEAPICQGQLRSDLGYNAATCIAPDILEGRYIYPEVFDQATKELCEECALIRKIIPKHLVKIKMTKEDFRAHWRRAKEETSSSFYGLHFGCYIAGIESDYISHFHALKATLLLHHGLVLERWAQGLLVMLQKRFGCSLITKLRAILLMEADFNGVNKTVYSHTHTHTHTHT